MVWQSPSPHANTPDGSSNGSGASSPGGGVQGNGSGSGGSTMGTEYTLQGVMRFLQTEWHRHERDRNNWEIERAEMKTRIAKLEGENRAEKRLHQVYLARIKILESAIKKERALRAAAEGKSEDALKTDEFAGKGKVENSINEKISSHLKPLDDSSALYRAESVRNKSRAYLEKCLQEITYLLTPPSHPSPQQQQPQQGGIAIDSILQQHQHQQQAIEHALFQQNSTNHQGLSQPSPSPSHQPPPPPSQGPDSLLSHRGQSMRGHQQSLFQSESRIQSGQPGIAIPSMSAEQNAEKLPSQLNAYNSVKPDYGKKDTNPFSALAMEPSVSHNPGTDVGDAWDFDEKIGESDTDSVSSSNSLSDALESYASINHPNKSSMHSSRRRLSMGSKRRSGGHYSNLVSEAGSFKVKFALRGHLDVVRAVVFTGGGTANEPEICTAGDDGVLKRWQIPGGPSAYHHSLAPSSGPNDTDVQSHFTHRGHAGIVTCLAAAPTTTDSGTADGWVFSGGQDSTVKVWEAGRVEARATLVGHTDTVWAVCVLPSQASSNSLERILLASGSADGTVKIWSVTPPPPPTRQPPSLSRGTGNRGNYNHNHNFNYSLIQTITRPETPSASPTCITPLSMTGETFVVAYDNANVVIFDTESAEEVASMMSQETYDGTPATGVSSVVCSTVSLDAPRDDGIEEDVLVAGATGLKGGVGGVVITGHEDQYVRFFDANSGQCTYTMLAHPAAIAALALSPDGRELVSAGHDASLRFWNMQKRACSQEITSHRLMRGEGVCAVVWSADGRWVVSGGGDGVVKVYCR